MLQIWHHVTKLASRYTRNQTFDVVPGLAIVKERCLKYINLTLLAGDRWYFLINNMKQQNH